MYKKYKEVLKSNIEYILQLKDKLEDTNIYNHFDYNLIDNKQTVDLLNENGYQIEDFDDDLNEFIVVPTENSLIADFLKREYFEIEDEKVNEMFRNITSFYAKQLGKGKEGGFVSLYSYFLGLIGSCSELSISDYRFLYYNKYLNFEDLLKDCIILLDVFILECENVLFHLKIVDKELNKITAYEI